jgi:hypothetical protein
MRNKKFYLGMILLVLAATTVYFYQYLDNEIASLEEGADGLRELSSVSGIDYSEVGMMVRKAANLKPFKWLCLPLGSCFGIPAILFLYAGIIIPSKKSMPPDQKI